jgi:hypothetical protein
MNEPTLIPGSANYLSLNIGNIRIFDEQIKDTIQITILDPPVELTDAVNKEYVDTLVGSLPGSPNTSVQFNDNGVFAGNSGLTFTAGTQTLNIENGIVNGTLTVPAPLNGTDAVNKDYVDGLIPSPGAPDTSVQFNNGGVFGGSADLTYDSGTQTLDMVNGDSSGTFTMNLSESNKMTLPNAPVDGTDAVNKDYVDGLIPTPGAPDTSVQFNNGGVFGGSADLTYDSGTQTLDMVNGDSSGTFTMNLSESNKMTLPNAPVDGTDAVNKDYVDGLIPTPGAPDTSVQFNNGGVFGGSADLTYDSGTQTLDMVNGDSSGTFTMNLSESNKMTLPNAPVDGTDAVNKDYVDTQIGSLVAAPDTSIQFNNGGVFGGSADLVWDDITKTMTVNGIIVSDEYLTSSTEKIKTNIEVIGEEEVVEKIRKIRGYKYEVKGKKKYGLIAEELENNNLEEMVIEKGGYKRVDYNQMIAILIEGMKKINEENKKLRQELNNQLQMIKECQNQYRMGKY